MRYLGLYENFKYYNEFNKMATCISNKFNIIGIKLDLNSVMARMHEDKYAVNIDFNLNGVKNSILWMLTQNILTEYKEPLNDRVYFISGSDSMSSTISSILVEDLFPGKMDDLYIKIMNNANNYQNNASSGVDIYLTTTNVRSQLTHDMKNLLDKFLKSNIYCDMNEVVMTDEFIELLFNTIYERENNYYLFNLLKQNQPLVFDKLNSKYSEAMNASKMGEKGFGD